VITTIDDVAAVPIALAVLVGILAGLLRGGRFVALGRTRIRTAPLLVVAVIVGVLVDVADLPAPGVWAIVGLVAGLGFATRNIHLVGMSIVGLGLALNLVPVAVNGAMPVRADALVEAGMVDAADLERVTLDGAREIAGPDTHLETLGDILPLGLTGQVLSFGDLIMLVGLADVVSNLMLQRRSRRLPAGATAGLAALGWRESAVGDGGIIDLEPVPTAQPSSITTASPVHDWGMAPPAVPVSASQYSARPDVTAPATVPERSDSATSDSTELVEERVADDLVVATHSR
jgi:hypothetical protein